MRFLIAPDSFKESMSAICAAKAIESGIKEVMPDSDCVIAPMADGGEGTAECLMYQENGQEISCVVTGPMGEKVEAYFVWFKEKKAALIEVAVACGLMLIPQENRDPRKATSYGVGELICEALKLNCKEIILSLGGTGTSDGGTGMLSALGAKILDKENNQISYGAKELDQVAHIDISDPINKLKGIKVTVLCDVRNKLLGKNGATYIFAPQKGAKKEELPILEAAMSCYAGAIERVVGIPLSDKEGSGAAGGIGFALFAICKAHIIKGSDYVMEALGLEAKIKDCDIVITGEGSIDAQSLEGKVPLGIAAMSKKYHKPVVVFAGKIGKITDEFYKNGITAVFGIIRELKPLEDVLENGEHNLKEAVKNFARILQMEDNVGKEYGLLNRGDRGCFFPKKKYEGNPLNTYEVVKEMLPRPLLEGNKYLECYDYAVKLAFGNVHAPTKESGYVSNFIDAAFNDDIFLWDTVFITMFCNLFHPYIPGICSLDNFYCKQFEDGEIPREMVRESGKDFGLWVNSFEKPLYSYFHNHYGHRRLKEMTNLKYEDLFKPELGRTVEKLPYLTLDNLNHPILAWAELQSYYHTGDIARLDMVYDSLYHYYLSLQYHIRHKNGLYVTDWASMDNSPRNKDLGFGIDINCEMVLFANHLTVIIDILRAAGKNGLEWDIQRSKLCADGTELKNLINDKMWNEEDGFYYDVKFDGTLSKVKTIAPFWAMIAGVAEGERLVRLVKWLNDKDTFNRVHRVPVCAATEGEYDPQGGYWKGSVWAPTNTMVILGLEQNGYHDLAKEIALNHLDNVCSVFQTTGTIWENYPADFVTSGNADNKDFVGWSGMAPILYLIQYKIGLTANAEKQSVDWEINKDILSEVPSGCKNYWFFGKNSDFFAYKAEGKLILQINTKDSFRLNVKLDQDLFEFEITGDCEFTL